MIHTTRAAERILDCPPGPFLRSRSLEFGLSDDAVEWLVQRGVLVQPVYGVLRRALGPDSLEARAAAAGLVLPAGAAFCRTTSAWLFGIDARPPGGHRTIPPVECVVPLGRTPIRRPGLRCYVADLRSDEVIERNGLPCTSPSRTSLDLARWSVSGTGLGALDAMARAGLIDPAELLELLERWRGCRFVDRARSLITWCDPLAESFGESCLRLRFLDAGFPKPQLQIPLADRDGILVYQLDLGYEGPRLSWEYDGEEYHLGAQAEAADRRRRAEIERRWG
ncbi:MAG TPA: type IV toxin-antitoxin system AbiEi family antitoxin, partial [Kineosporiaceae bacterium]|nr:type IV toxin-antitoxin system AbiEi family antitoxin [Kineosporiaceae bacterium]